MEGPIDDGLASSQPSGDMSLSSTRKSAFERELPKLLAGSPYRTFPEFETAFSTFQRDGFSSMTRTNNNSHANTGKEFFSYRCEKPRDEDKDKKCAFTILVRRKDNGLYYVSLGNNGLTEHKHEQLQGPTRLTAVLVNSLHEKIREQGANGKFGLDAQIAVVKEIYEEKNTVVTNRAYNRLRREIETSQFTTLLYKGLANTGALTLKIGETETTFPVEQMHPDLAAVIGLLRMTQHQYPTAYINVGFENNVLCYIFISLPQQRQWGAKWSDLVQLDDKAGVSTVAMHIATWIVVSPENHNLPAAFVLMDRNSVSNWTNFVEDAKKAFTCTEKNGFLRGIETVISDEAGCIASAVKTATGLTPDTCSFHFSQRMRAQYRPHMEKIQPILDLMNNLLQKDQHYNVPKWTHELEALISALPSGELKGNLRQMQMEVKQRTLATLRRFTNEKSSQSGSESQNSVLAKLQIASNVPLYSVVKKMVEYAEVKGLREQALRTPKRPQMLQMEAEVLGEVSKVASDHALEWMRKNFQDGLSYTLVVVKDTIPESQWKLTRIGAKPETSVRVTRTWDEKSDLVIWTCQSGCVAKGLPCRHIMAAARLRRMQDGASRALPVTSINSRWFRADLQRDLVLPLGSPLSLGGTALGVRDVGSLIQENALKRGEVPNSNPVEEPWEDEFGLEQDDLGDIPDHGSEEEQPVRIVGGQHAAVPLKPTEIRSAMREQFYLVQRLCGNNPEKMNAFIDVMKSFENQLAPKPLVPSLPASAVASGRPRTGRIKPGDEAKKTYRVKEHVVKARHNGKRIRGPVHCRNCGKTGHNSSTCKKEKRNKKAKRDE